MKKEEHAQMVTALRGILERNVNNTLTPELATGILAVFEHGANQLIDKEADENGEHQ
ncbi:MAG: hypothetical protein Q8L20_10675 [Gammaproteobacteria bacterium]|nr:hypothetical protein [Gammaproteobacteria bacterium]